MYFTRLGWMGLFLLEQKENFLQIRSVPHKSHFFNFLFQILNSPNCPDSTMYDTLYFDVKNYKLAIHLIGPLCALTGGWGHFDV